MGYRSFSKVFGVIRADHTHGLPLGPAFTSVSGPAHSLAADENEGVLSSAGCFVLDAFPAGAIPSTMEGRGRLATPCPASAKGVCKMKLGN